MRRHYLLDTGIAQDYQAGRGGFDQRKALETIVYLLKMVTNCRVD